MSAIGIDLVVAEGGTAVGRRREEPGPPTADAGPEHKATDIGCAPKPHGIGGHRLDGVIAQQCDEPVYVVTLEGVDVASQ